MSVKISNGVNTTKSAVIFTGGKQYLVQTGDIIKIEKIKKPENGVGFYFDKVLLIFSGNDIKIGKPYLENAKIEAEIMKVGRSKKISILRYHSKTRHRRKKGHRQEYAEVKIKGINPVF